MATADRRDLVDKAELAERSGRWEDMVTAMRQVLEFGTDLSLLERNLLASAFKHFVGGKRAAWRVVCCIEERIIGPNVKKRKLAHAYRLKIEQELKDTCTELLKITDNLLKKSKDVEGRIFYLKLRGDYYRYMSEFSNDVIDGDIPIMAKEAYTEALELAKKHLNNAQPLHLGLVLNASVFYYEVLHAYEAAVAMVTGCISEAKEGMQQLDACSKGDSTVILGLLKENVKLWKSDMANRRKKIKF